jgi:hypothetical protein
MSIGISEIFEPEEDIEHYNTRVNPIYEQTLFISKG